MEEIRNNPVDALHHHPVRVVVLRASRLGIDLDNQHLYGFALLMPDSIEQEVWDALAEEWRDEIAYRTTTRVPAAVQEQLVLTG
jgi:hypothetical protein